jgi:hypothetical protein
MKYYTDIRLHKNFNRGGGYKFSTWQTAMDARTIHIPLCLCQMANCNGCQNHTHPTMPVPDRETAMDARTIHIPLCLCQMANCNGCQNHTNPTMPVPDGKQQWMPEPYKSHYASARSRNSCNSSKGQGSSNFVIMWPPKIHKLTWTPYTAQRNHRFTCCYRFLVGCMVTA